MARSHYRTPDRLHDRTHGLPEEQHPTTRTNINETERMISLVGGPALALFGITRQSAGGVALTAIAGWLFYRGLTGHDPVYEAIGVNTATTGLSDLVAVPHDQGERVEHTITINRPVEDVYSFWRNFENLPRFMQYLESVKVTDDKHSHWVAIGPAGLKVEWDAEIINEVRNEVIGWRSLEGPTIENAGSVRFRPAPGGQGTEVKVNMKYNPPAGKVGATVAKILARDPEQTIEEDLRRFKQIMETGVTTDARDETFARGNDMR